MIGYNEYQEAMNLLALLLESRQKLAMFNATDEDIARAMDADVRDAQAMRTVRAAWYGDLAAWAREKRLSGGYALCFTDETQVQRKPYDLLARLDPTDEETQEASLPPALLRGLTTQEAQRASRLYHRLLCIQPMRVLLARLHALDAALEKEGEKRIDEICKEVEKPAFRRIIPAYMERRSGYRLDLADNNFTILDRLMDNWDRPLRHEEAFSLPQAAMAHTSSAETLLTAAIVRKVGGEAAPGARAQYRAIPGGHTALGVYGDKGPAAFFDAVVSNQARSEHKLMRVQGYAGTQLVQLTDEAARCFSLAEDGQAEAFAAQDDGGRHLLDAVAGALENRRQLQGEACLELFIKDQAMNDDQRLSALEELRRIVTEFFREPRLPKKINGEIRQVKNSSANLSQRIVCLIIAHLARGGMLKLPCPQGNPPQELMALIDRMRDDPAACAAFVADVNGMEAAQTRLDMRYAGKGDKRTLYALRGQEAGWEVPVQWLAGVAALPPDALPDADEPPFDADALMAIVLEGLRRFLYFGRQVGTGESAAFSLKVESQGARPKDIFFRLLCLWCVKACNGGETVRLTADEKNPENSVFTMRKGDRSFVGMFARTDTEADAVQLTPARLRTFLQQTVASNLTIRSEKDGSFTIMSPVQP